MNRIPTFWVFAVLLFLSSSAFGQSRQEAKQPVQELQQLVDDLKADNPDSPQLATLELKLQEAKQPATAPSAQKLKQSIQGYQTKLEYLEQRKKANPANTAISKRIQEMKAQMGKLQLQLDNSSDQ
ncbi:MAG TPA: hypothetical protein ENJ95_09580 [Bacteroidetes bacterium]|nr:hypothetical protein [Bacteroidota bacterium]